MCTIQDSRPCTPGVQLHRLAADNAVLRAELGALRGSGGADAQLAVRLAADNAGLRSERDYLQQQVAQVCCFSRFRLRGTAV